jgi:nucleoside-diphosphate-sugar epimerase
LYGAKIIVKTLITGATGFIGSHLLPRLIAEGHDVVAALRNRTSATKLSQSIAQIIVGEINRHTDWHQALVGIDTVIHLAGRAHILQEVGDPEAEFMEINFYGTQNLIRQAIAAGVKHFIFISSIGAVTSQSDRPLTEATSPHPNTPYGRSKLRAEQSLIELTENTSMTWTILRPTLVYGAGNPGNMASLVKLIKSRLPLPLGAIDNRRSFLYVGNLVDAIAVCSSHPSAKNQLFLISDAEQISTPTLIDRIARSLNTPVTLLPIPPQMLKFLGNLGDMGQSILKKSLPLNSGVINKLLASLAVDSSKIHTTLHWQPPYTLERGIEKGLS